MSVPILKEVRSPPLKMSRSSDLVQFGCAEVGFENDFVAECFQALDEASCCPEDVVLVKVIGAEVLIAGAALEHVIARGEDRAGYRDERSFRAA